MNNAGSVSHGQTRRGVPPAAKLAFRYAKLAQRRGDDLRQPGTSRETLEPWAAISPPR